MQLENGMPGKDFDVYFDTPNRSVTIGRLEEIFADQRKRLKGAVLKIYVENFKFFNDTFGYQNGGLLLKEIALFLCGQPGSDVFRLGGVEFVIVLDGCNYAKTMEIAQTILDRFEDTWCINDLDCMCSVNMGIAFYPGIAENAEELLSHLDHAITEATQFGQNQLAVYDTGLAAKLYRKFGIAKNITKALLSGDIEIQYRPIFNTHTERFVRAEIYLRLFTVEFGIVNSAEFLPIAEDSGQICALNSYAIRRACELIRDLMAEGKDFESISVPISPVQFLQERFPHEVCQAIEEFGIPHKKLAFEITESILISSFSRVHLVMDELSEMGVEFVLNEFGTGFSGINNLLSLPVDVLKLERLFMWQLETNPMSGHVIEGLISIAKKLGLKLIAEGVETDNQVALLSKYGCDYQQGFYYSPTVGADELKELFAGV